MPQPPKGEREPFTVRVPPPHAEVYRREATQRGLRWSDYLALVLAEAHGLDTPPWMQASENQEVLPKTA